jgi:hypothetical protein
LHVREFQRLFAARVRVQADALALVQNADLFLDPFATSVDPYA